MGKSTISGKDPKNRQFAERPKPKVLGVDPVSGETMLEPVPNKRKGMQSAMTESQALFVHYYIHERLPTSAAAKAAGLNPSQGFQLLKNEKVKAAIALAQQEYAEATNLKRGDVVRMLQESYQLAKTLGEPSAMVAGAREIGKILGLYEPETRRVEVSGKVRVSVDDLKKMTDDELLRLAYDDKVVIAGDFEDVTPEA